MNFRNVFIAALWLTMDCVSSFAGWAGHIVDVSTGTQLDLDGLIRAVADSRTLVLGEKHNTPEVQRAQARVIEVVTKARGAEGRFTTAWEFLDVGAQNSVSMEFGRFSRNEITGVEFLNRVQGSTYNWSYLPILDTTRLLGGDLLAVNLSRAQKAPVVRSGIKAADPALIPPGYESGSAQYFARFSEAMGEGHATPEQIQNYFDAQCLTDDVMAYEMLARARPELHFLVVGSFHSDYFEGTVRRLSQRAPGERVRVIRFIDMSDYTEAEIPDLLKSPAYGDIADIAVFVNEPVATPTIL
jgi:uncharacterized iron-regulated protein